MGLLATASIQFAGPRINGINIEGDHRNPKINKSNTSQPTAFPSIHPSHQKMMLRNIVFCKRCGYSTSRKTQKLSEKCHLQPTHNDVKHKLKRMMEGKHPDRLVLVA